MSQIKEQLDRIESLLIRDGKQHLTLLEAANYLDISSSHLYKLTSAGLIARSKPGGKRIYFLKSDLNTYLLRNRIECALEDD